MMKNLLRDVAEGHLVTRRRRQGEPEMIFESFGEDYIGPRETGDVEGEESVMPDHFPDLLSLEVPTPLEEEIDLGLGILDEDLERPRPDFEARPAPSLRHFPSPYLSPPPTRRLIGIRRRKPLWDEVIEHKRSLFGTWSDEFTEDLLKRERGELAKVRFDQI